MTSKTLSPNNQFCFKCPIFGAEVELRTCLAIRDEVWKGKRLEKRLGCQALMTSNKCPTNEIIKSMIRLGDDPYHSVERRVGNLRPELLERIHPVLTDERTLDKFGVPENERVAIRAANNRAGEKVKFKAAPVSLASDIGEAKPRKVVSEDHSAAVTGDMSAAVNKALEKLAAEAPPAKEIEVVVEAAPEPVEVPVVAPAPKAPPKAAAPATKPASPTKGLSLLEMARARAAAMSAGP